MAKARPHERVFALVVAFLFLATTVATGLAIVWTVRNDNKQGTIANQSETGEGMLKGTKLADFTPVDTVDGLQKIDLKEGTGEVVKPGATVTVNYTGALASTGVVFESSKDSGQPVSFPLSGVIKGWTNGVPGMKEGGTRRLLIPAAQAYGAQAAGDIPANSALVFDIELISINK